MLPGFTGESFIETEEGSVAGVITGPFGIGKDGAKKDNYMAGMRINAKQTIFTEGARGSITESLKARFKLDKDAVSLQHYGIGLKEIWEVSEDNPHFKAGHV